MYCKVCGCPIKNGNKYCARCGSAIDYNAMNNSIDNNNVGRNLPVNNNNNNFKKGIIIFVVVILVFVVVLGINKVYKDINGHFNNIEKNYNDNNSLGNNDTFIANNVKKYSALGYMDYNVPDCWVYNDTMSSNMQYRSYVFLFKDNISMLNVKAGTLTGYKSEIERYNYFMNQILDTYGSIKNEEIKYFNNKKWYVITTNQYNYSYGNVNYYNKIYFTFSNSASHLYYFEAYVNNDISDKQYIDDSIEYIINSAKLYKVDD